MGDPGCLVMLRRRGEIPIVALPTVHAAVSDACTMMRCNGESNEANVCLFKLERQKRKLTRSRQYQCERMCRGCSCGCEKSKSCVWMLSSQPGALFVACCPVAATPGSGAEAYLNAECLPQQHWLVYDVGIGLFRACTMRSAWVKL